MTTTVTRRNRNLAYAWTNQPVSVRTSNGSSYLAVHAPTTPDITGLTVRQLLDLHRETRQRNRGNEWAFAVFVGGHRIIPDEWCRNPIDALRMLYEPDERIDEIEVDLDDTAAESL